MPRSLSVKLAWRPLTHLLTSAALQLLTCSCSSSLFPTLAPPFHVVVNGERKTLVFCLVRELSEDTLDAVWFSNGNGSLLESFNYGISKDADGTFSTIAQISISTSEFESWNSVTCYVAQNETSKAWSNTLLQPTARDQILSAEVLHTSSQALFLLAIRVLLFKFVLFDVLMTCCILYKK
ncbi:Pre T-cell antigen receptor alpha [Varanus komodoensis]|nr:Pre T-cell antigen receptor alpha [Varanus komodoensis]